MPEPLISIVISSYNYEAYLRQAIDSALNQTYRNVEVVVVDDGSTDNSPEIIRSYGNRIVAALKSNGGQASALNAGFTLSHGEMVFFLDSDDFLLPQAAERVVRAYRSGVSKVQYHLQLVNSGGKHLGIIRSQERDPLSGTQARDFLLRRGWYVTTPTSGSAYARSALAHILPIPEKDFIVCPDAYLNMVSPFEGEVISIPEVLAAYSCHGSNFFHWRAETAPTQVRLEYEIRAQKYLLKAARAHGFDLPANLELRNFVYVRTRLVSLCMAPHDHPFPGDTRRGLAWQGVSAIWRWWGDLDWRRRTIWTLWFLLTAISPRPMAEALIRWAYNQGERPRILRRVFSWVNRVSFAGHAC